MREKLIEIFKSISPKRVFKLFTTILIIFISLQFWTIFCFYIFDNQGHNLLYLKKNTELSETKRQLLIENISFFERLLIVGYYSSNYIDDMQTLKDLKTEEADSQAIERVQQRIDERGTCQINGNTVSFFSYFYTYTILGIPYKEITITCKDLPFSSK